MCGPFSIKAPSSALRLAVASGISPPAFLPSPPPFSVSDRDAQRMVRDPEGLQRETGQRWVEGLGLLAPIKGRKASSVAWMGLWRGFLCTGSLGREALVGVQ